MFKKIFKFKNNISIWYCYQAKEFCLHEWICLHWVSPRWSNQIILNYLRKNNLKKNDLIPTEKNFKFLLDKWFYRKEK